MLDLIQYAKDELIDLGIDPNDILSPKDQHMRKLRSLIDHAEHSLRNNEHEALEDILAQMREWVNEKDRIEHQYKDLVPVLVPDAETGTRVIPCSTEVESDDRGSFLYIKLDLDDVGSTAHDFLSQHKTVGLSFNYTPTSRPLTPPVHIEEHLSNG